MRSAWVLGTRHRLHAGYTLLELALAVTVSGAVLTGALIFAAQVWAEQRADAFAQSMVQLVQSVNAMFPGSSAAYDKLTLQTAIQLGVFSDEQVDAAAGTVNHLYGQPISMGGLAGVGLNNQAWGLHYARLPANACLAVLQYALKVADAVALVADPLSNANATEFSNWDSKIGWANGEVTGFPVGYMYTYTPPGGVAINKVLKSNRTDVPTASDRITACQTATNNPTSLAQGSTFGLALVLRRL